MDTKKNIRTGRGRNKSKKDVQGNEKVKQKFNKTQLQSGLQTNKVIPAPEKQIVIQKKKRLHGINKSTAVCQPKDERNTPNKNVTMTPQNLNIHQQSVIKNSLKKYDNQIMTNTNDSNQTQKINLNIHQLKVLEKLAQKKKDFKRISQKRRNDKFNNSIDSRKSHEIICDTAKDQKEPCVSLEPQATVFRSRPTCHSINLAADKISPCVKSANWKVAPSLPIPKINNVKNKEQDNEHTPKRSFATIKKNSAEKRLQKLRKRLSDPIQKEIKPAQTLLGTGSPVSITRSPVLMTGSPLPLTKFPISITWSPASVSRSPVSKYNLLQRKDDLRKRGSQSAEKHLLDLKKKESKASSSSGPEPDSSDLQNQAKMIIDDFACKRKSYEAKYSISKRTKVEPSAQLSNIDTENIHPNGYISNRNLAISTNTTTENSSIHSSSAIDQPNSSFDELMDWETVVEQIIQVREESEHSFSKSNIDLFNDKNNVEQLRGASGIVFIVVDTNIFISHLSTVEKLTDESKQVGSCEYRIMVPWIVLCELDKLKSCSNVSFSNNHMMARRAIRFLHDNLSSNPKICGQSLKVANDHVFPCSLPDDQILNCCLQLSGSGNTVILLTNDKNLCNKAAINGIKKFTHEQFIADYFDLLHDRSLSVSTNLISSKSTPKIDKYEKAKSDYDKKTKLRTPKALCSNGDKLKRMEVLLHKFLSVVLESEMKERFDELWIKVVFIEPPWSLSDILKCLVKHWIAVFKEILPNEAQTIAVDLQHYFSPRKKATFNTNSESNFKVISSLGIKLVECFQINSKYSILARECLREILNPINNFNNQETDILVENLISTTTTTEENSSNSYLNNNYSLQKIIQENKSKERFSPDVPNNQISTSSKHIIGVLKIIWEGLCKFCTDLANTLEVSHNLSTGNDKVAPLGDLVSQATSVGNQLQSLVSCNSRMIASFLEHSPLDQRQKEASLASEALTNILYDTLCGMGHKSTTLDAKDVLAFCTLHRNLLEEAYNKFIVLHNLIMECSQKYAALQTNGILQM